MRLTAFIIVALCGCSGGEPSLGISAVSRCSGEAIRPSGRPIALGNEVYEYGDGSVLATCFASDGFYKVLGISGYGSDELGRAEARCDVGLDVAGLINGGTWSFSLPSKSVAYLDDGAPEHGVTYPLVCDRHEVITDAAELEADK